MRSRLRAALEDFGQLVLFGGETLAWAARPPWRWELLLGQMEAIGVGSTLIVAVTGLFAGMVLALQGNYALGQFGAQGYTGGFVMVSLVRELAPVLTALIVTGRSGSAISTELGTMRVTEQIDAMETMAVNPVQYLAVPRVAASVVMFPILTVVFSAVGYLGAYLIGIQVSQIPPAPFIDHTRGMVEVGDLTHGLSKSLAFGAIVSVICCYRGYAAHGGAKGVGEGTTRAVVMSSIAILVLDYLLTFISIGA
ncbi:MAG TPA: ABC transporter permease [Anaeromyxobacteraceae bacterium]|nr:ABC transporter permease [Anaeromyxobacteraceae bacterium]